MKSLILASLVAFSSATAHEDHDWREDYMGYLSVQYELPTTYQKSARRAFARKRLDMDFFKTKLSVLTGTTPYGTLSRSWASLFALKPAVVERISWPRN